MRASWYRETWRSALVGIVVVLAGSLLLGGLTSFGQTYLPAWASSFSNSAGGWTLLAFLLVWASRVHPLLGAVLGAVAFVGLNEGYGVVSAWRGHFYAEPFASVWTRIGLVVGPLVGASASVARYGTPLWRALAVTPLCAVLLGEGVWALNAIADTTSPVYWIIEIVLSVLFMALVLWRRRLRMPQIVLVLAVWLVGTLVYAVGWSVFAAG
ncbi:DUF6518 family protein [Microbacterium mangrovi]|uniref:DUF6518 family protein n=1 Tax=Microbacterium mangrovi TaxID=1348253 RepID=UPI00068E9816|nr:DUF6518 family protein [Microbacterium mangrovi]